MSSEAQAASGLSSSMGPVPKDSRTPLLSGTNDGQDSSGTGESGSDKDGKSRKRDFFRFGKKVEEEKKTKPKPPSMPVTAVGQMGAVNSLRPVSPLTDASQLRSAVSPPRTHPYGSPGLPASPGRHRLQSASPRNHSPSTSQIFERNVQEDVLPPQASPQIPSHIITENHIPPALDASSEAITNAKLDPDTVEIVTHANHQPAAATIPGANETLLGSSTHEDFLSHVARQDTDSVSNYGSLDVGDVRRLSFISFADVVHAEQELEEQRRDSAAMQSLDGHTALAPPRSPSPMRPLGAHPAPAMSPVSGVSTSIKGQEVSPTRGLRGPGSPLPGQSTPVGASELNIETMRQALRKTGSGDLSGFRSGSASAVGLDH